MNYRSSLLVLVGLLLLWTGCKSFKEKQDELPDKEIKYESVKSRSKAQPPNSWEDEIFLMEIQDVNFGRV